MTCRRQIHSTACRRRRHCRRQEVEGGARAREEGKEKRQEEQELHNSRFADQTRPTPFQKWGLGSWRRRRRHERVFLGLPLPFMKKRKKRLGNGQMKRRAETITLLFRRSRFESTCIHHAARQQEHRFWLHCASCRLLFRLTATYSSIVMPILGAPTVFLPLLLLLLLRRENNKANCLRRCR